MKNRLLLYSDDCNLGGSEMLVTNIIKNKSINDLFEVLFVYRYSKSYQQNIEALFGEAERKNFFPIKLLSNDTLFNVIDSKDWHILGRVIKKIFYLLSKIGIYSFINKILLRRCLSTLAPNLIHINNGGYPAAETCLDVAEVANNLGIKVLFQINNIPTSHKRARDKKIKKSVNGFITASRNTAKLIKEKRDIITDDNIFILPNTVKQYKPTINALEQRGVMGISADSIVIIEVALLLSYKGQLELIKALEQIKSIQSELYDKIVIVLVGSGNNESTINQYVVEHGLTDKVLFLGYRHDYINLINMSDILVLPSITNEDMPLSILNAMSLSKPTIGTNVGGIPEEIEHMKSGIVIDATQDFLPDNICNAILKILESKNEYGNYAYEKYQREFSEDAHYQKLIEIYNIILTHNIK